MPDTYTTRDGFTFTPISVERRIEIARLMDESLRAGRDHHIVNLLTYSEMLWLMHETLSDEHWDEVREN